MDKKIKIIKPFQYDENLIMQCGVYNFDEYGVNGYPMIYYNDSWYDLCEFEMLTDFVIIFTETGVNKK